MPSLPIRQIAYFVRDIRQAALAHHRQFGSGPYFLSENVALTRNEFRGEATPHDHSSAYGQWGEVMLEFVQQNDAHPSAFHAMYPDGSGRFGLHHMAIWVDDLSKAIADHEAHGMPVIQYAETASGVAYAFVDARETLGHMIELYEPNELLTGFYGMVADTAKNWDGSNPLRSLG